MTNTKLIITFTVIILSSVLMGCINQQEPPSTPTPEKTPVVTQISESTPTPTYTPVPTPKPTGNPVVYKADVDNWRGFVRIVGNSPNQNEYDFYNRTLTLNAGDTMIWVNDAD
ncbi:MAG TPA: hypothetical protein VIO11_04175, partial [Candidatus Methanoperedens sp.]